MLLSKLRPKSPLPGFIISSKRREGEMRITNGVSCAVGWGSLGTENHWTQESHDVHFSLTTTAPADLTSTSYPWVSSGILITLIRRDTETVSKLSEKQYLNLSTKSSSLPLSMISFSLDPRYPLYSVLITLINHCVIWRCDVEYKARICKIHSESLGNCKTSEVLFDILSLFSSAFLLTSVNHRFPCFHLVTI